jgi:general secretion pathway protein D
MIKTVRFFYLPCFILIFYGDLCAQDVHAIAEREVVRRQKGIGKGEAALVQARAALKAKDFSQAHESYRAACDLLPAGATTVGGHAEALHGFCESGVKLAEARIAEGKYDEAQQIVREIVSERYDPDCRRARDLLRHFDEPGFINKTIGPKFMARVEDVRRLLDEAEGFFQSGRYDLAMKKYDQVLALDPYNVAARRGQERLDLTKTHYSEEAYNETRARQLWQVQKSWEEPVRDYGKAIGPVTDVTSKDLTGTARITNKLNSIIIPKIEFRDASIREAIDFVRQQAVANDPATEGRRGVDIVSRFTPLGRPATEAAAPIESSLPPPATAEEPNPPPASPAPATIKSPATFPGDARITLILNEIPLGEALRYIASQAGLKVKVEPYAVSIVPISDESNDLFTKEYRVPPGFISTSVNIGASAFAAQAAPAAGASSAATGTGRDTQEATGGRQLVNREGAKEFLETQGVQFPVGASAHFLPDSSRLIVRNTEDNLELVDALVEQANVAGPKQVEIEAKFVEINQNNLKELGFDWLLGTFGVGTNKIRLGGGTSGTGTRLNQANFPNSIVDPATGQVSQFPVTAGNRSGNLAISGSAIDSLLTGTGVGQVPAPGIFSVAGLMTNPEFQVVIRALNQKKGIDLLSAPRVTTKSGQRALIEIVREFRYPTQFTEPKVPDIQGRGSTNTTTTTIALPVVGPSTPSNFETRNTGVTLEVEPVVGPDGVTIDLNLVPQVVEFEGFINYGSPISTVNPALLGFLGLPGNLLGTQQSIVLTDNVINQPIFSSRKVTTNVSVFDGQTVVLGGLMREDVQKTEDRTPIIGDLPIVGRLFRTNAEQHIKRNLVIFVTARLVTPGGVPVNQTEEEEELEPPILPDVPIYKK